MKKSIAVPVRTVAVIEAIIIVVLILYINILKKDLSSALKNMNIKPMNPDDLLYQTNTNTSSISNLPNILCPDSNGLTPSVREIIKFRGVAVTTFLGSPKYVI